jgi:uncharacterized protein (DUF2147 family)
VKYALLLLVCCSALVLAADERDAVFGRWASERSILEIAEVDGQLQARVVALLNPVYGADETIGEAGAVRVDAKNPDAALRARPILGINLLADYRFDNGKWQGRIYDPESGKTYQSQMSVDADGMLQMRGYVGVPMFGRTAIFRPVTSCSGNIPKMLALAELPSTCSA